MNAHELDRRLALKEQRIARVTRVIPYVALVGSVILALSFQHIPSLGHGPSGLVWPALTALWLLGWDALPQASKDRQALKNVYVVGMLACTAALVYVSPMYGFFAWWNYHSADYLPGRWRMAGVFAGVFLHVTAIFGGMRMVLGLSAPGAVSFVFVVAMISAAILAFGRISDIGAERSEHRRRMVNELTEANRRLEELIKENEGLHAQLLTQAREAGVLDERQRMAREIHDTLAQGLTGIITQVQAAKNAADRPEDWRAHLDTAVRLARDSLAEARRSVQALGPAALETARLPDALAEVARQWSESSGVPVEATTTGTARRMHPEVEVTLLRAAQEALANVAKHAGASRAGVTLSYMEDVVTLDVMDDGVGFDADRVQAAGAGRDERGPLEGGFGLKAMRQRVDRLGGRLTIESEPGAGTVVSATLPAVQPQPQPQEAAHAQPATSW